MTEATSMLHFGMHEQQENLDELIKCATIRLPDFIWYRLNWAPRNGPNHTQGFRIERALII